MDWRAEITAGEPVAKMMKEFFYPNETYSSVAIKLGGMLAKLKHEASRYWPELSPVQRLHKLASFSREDMQEGLQIPDSRPAPKKGSIGAALALPKEFTIDDTKDGGLCETRTAGT